MENGKKRSWTSKYIPRPASGLRTSNNSNGQLSNADGRIKNTIVPLLEGQVLPSSVFSTPASSRPTTPTQGTIPLPGPGAGSGKGLLMRRDTGDSLPSTVSSTPRRLSFVSSLTSSSPKLSPQELDQQASQVILNALERTQSAQQQAKSTSSESRGAGSFGKMSFSSMMGGLSSLSLSRTNTNTSTTGAFTSTEENKDKDSSFRGRSMLSGSRTKSASQAPAADNTDTSRSRSRARSQSPFTFRRFRNRESSPMPQPIPLGVSDAELSDSSSNVRPRSTAFTDEGDSGDEDTDADEDDYSDDDFFDPVTERNTERNALITSVPGEGAIVDAEVDVDPDPLGEGVNVVVPPEPYFPSTLNSGLSGAARGKRNPRRRKSMKTHEPLPYQTSRPIFQRDRCTITITQGDPEGKLGDRKRRRYIVASDLSEESRYALEWGIGTVLRDGDEMMIVTISENESKVDPAIPSAADRSTKLRSQQERQGLAYILVRQATSLLHRTKLNVIVSCQAWHAKNARHMLLDIVDFYEPTMLIVGSRGLGQLKGILLGSTSHYLIQKCSVPVMVARRRLKRPPRRSAHLSTHRAHVSLAEAGIDRVAARVDQDVQVMRDEIQREDNRRGDGGSGSRDDSHSMSVAGEDIEDDGEYDGEGDGYDNIAVKVVG